MTSFRIQAVEPKRLESPLAAFETALNTAELKARPKFTLTLLAPGGAHSAPPPLLFTGTY